MRRHDVQQDGRPAATRHRLPELRSPSRTWRRGRKARKNEGARRGGGGGSKTGEKEIINKGASSHHHCGNFCLVTPNDQVELGLGGATLVEPAVVLRKRSPGIFFPPRTVAARSPSRSSCAAAKLSKAGIHPGTTVGQRRRQISAGLADYVCTRRYLPDKLPTSSPRRRSSGARWRMHAAATPLNHGTWELCSVCCSSE